jgi:hypothetical protein
VRLLSHILNTKAKQQKYGALNDRYKNSAFTGGLSGREQKSALF